MKEVIKRCLLISMPIVVFVLVIISLVVTSRERAEDIIYGLSAYDAPPQTIEVTSTKLVLSECERFCNYTKKYNETQPEFMVQPLSDAYCLLGFNESIYKKDINSDGVLEFIPCPGIHTCLINFENIGKIELNCTR